MESILAGKIAGSPVARWFKKNSSLLALLVIFAACSLISPYFFTLYNLQNILRQIGVNGLLALGLTLVILVGGIDLSIGGTLGLVAIVSALMLQQGAGLLEIVLVALLIGSAVGVVNGFLITTFALEPFVITLGMQFVLRGMCFSLTNGRTIFVEMPEAVGFIANGYIGPIPFPAVILAVIYFIFFLFLRFSTMGRYLYAVGGNEEAVRRAGLNNKLVKIVVYTVCGATAALAGIMNFSRINVGDPQAGDGIVLFIIGAVIIGGNRFVGGIGGVWRTIIGLLMIMMISNIIILVGLSYYIQLIAEGTIIIVAVLLQRRRRQ